MPRELSEAPVALSPRNQKSVADQLKQSLEQRESILTNGRIEQLQSENEMLKEQLKVGQPPNQNELLANAEEKARLVQAQLDE